MTNKNLSSPVSSDENRYMVQTNENRVKILMVDKTEKRKVLSLLLQCLSTDNDVFYNINEGNNELSIVADMCFEKYIKQLPCVYYPDIYRVIQIHEGCPGIDHIGTVSEISSLFADINISILYINTYNNNFILIKEKDYTKGINALISIDYKIL